MASSGWVRRLPDDESGQVEAPEPEPDAPEEVQPEQPATAEDRTLAQGEEWIEEYESERRDTRPRRRVPHPVGIAIAVAVVLVLVVWTLMSPQVLPVAGTAYVDSEVYANLGSFQGDLEIKWLLDLVKVADTTWGVSIGGDSAVPAGEPATFTVLVTKVREDMANAWFVGTSIDLRKADLVIDGGPKVGSLVSESSEQFGPLGTVEATFGSPGNYSCEVFVEVAIYSKMLIGFAPVKVLRMTVDLEVDIVVS